MTDHAPQTEQQPDEIETRAAHLHEYATLTDGPLQADADQLTGKDVPALVTAVRRQRAELERRTEDLAFLERTTLPELRREIEHHKDGKQRWRVRAETAEARAAAVAAFLDEQERAARAFELPTPAWVEAVRAASVPPAAPLSASQPSSVSESAQSPTGAPTGPRRTLTPNEYDSAWHAVEGAAGEEGADPGTVLHAVLDRLGIEWQDAAQRIA